MSERGGTRAIGRRPLFALLAATLLAAAPAPARAEGQAATGSTELTVVTPDARPWVTAPVAPAFADKADTWVSVASVPGMEWELLRVGADGTREPVEGHGWNDGASRFEGLEPGVAYAVRGRLRDGLTEAPAELLVTTYAAAAPPRIEATGVGPAPSGGFQAQAVGAWLRVLDEGDAQGTPDAEGASGRRLEWSLDGEAWQQSPLFEGLEPGGGYAVYARVRGGTVASEPTRVTLPAVRDEGSADGQPGQDPNRRAVLSRGSDPGAAGDRSPNALRLPKTGDLAFALGAFGVCSVAGALVLAEAWLLRRWEGGNE